MREEVSFFHEENNNQLAFAFCFVYSGSLVSSSYLYMPQRSKNSRCMNRRSGGNHGICRCLLIPTRKRSETVVNPGLGGKWLW